MSELWTDLRRLVEKTAPSGARDVHERVRGDRRAGIEAGRMTASADWDELFGGSDEGDDSDSLEPQPEPRRVPSTRPAPRGPRANNARTPSPHWTVDSFGVDDIAVTTRIRTSLSRGEASTSASASGRSTLRRAMEDILRADGLVGTRAGNDDDVTAANGKADPVDEFDLLLRKEKQMTRDLRERMRKMMERRRKEEQSAEPSLTSLPAPTETPSLTTYSSTHPCSMAMSSDQERMKLTSRVRGPRGAAVVVRDALMSRQSSGSCGRDNLSPRPLGSKRGSDFHRSSSRLSKSFLCSRSDARGHYTVTSRRWTRRQGEKRWRTGARRMENSAAQSCSFESR